MNADRLRHLLDYDPMSGLFTWRVHRAPNARSGDVAGTVGRDGYVQIYVDGKPYKAHRLAWLHVTGGWPPNCIDHSDGDRTNNRWTNLRSATVSQNNANCGARSQNTTGLKGVCFVAKRGHWIAQIQVQGRCKYLGSYRTPEEAHAAYAAAAAVHFQQFARTA